MAGARPKISATRLISRWACSPSNMSRMTVRLTIVAPPAASPWTTRPANSSSKVGAKVQATDATAYTLIEARMTGRRPSESDSGPWKMLIAAKASR